MVNDYQRDMALGQLRDAVRRKDAMHALWQDRIRQAVALGIPLRPIGRAAGVDASTVKRIAERQK